MTRAAAIASVIILGATFASNASAQQDAPHELDAPKQSLEFAFAGGYTQGTGEIRENGERVSRFAGPGFEGVLDIGYRADHRVFFGVYGTFARYNSPTPDWTGISARGVSAGLQAQVHFLPFGRIDPWISLGAGYRGLFSSANDGPVEARHGVQLARLRVGVDMRLGTAVAIGPVVGVDGTMFLVTRDPVTSETSRVDSDKLTVAPFFFAGLAGRFDVVNKRAHSTDRTIAAAF